MTRVNYRGGKVATRRDRGSILIKLESSSEAMTDAKELVLKSPTR